MRTDMLADFLDEQVYIRYGRRWDPDYDKISMVDARLPHNRHWKVSVVILNNNTNRFKNPDQMVDIAELIICSGGYFPYSAI